MSSFLDKLTTAIRRNDSLLCLGLDPEVGKFPAELLPGASEEERLVAWCTRLIEQTSAFICCVKPNIAFFEQYGLAGLNALKRILAAVPEDIPVLLDAKRGDIGSTAAAYAKACFEFWGADAVTHSPYLGKDSIEPFLAYPGKTVFVLCQTSNPSAGEIQGHGEEPLFQHVARTAQTWGSPEQIAFVVGATWPQSLAAVRAIAPQNWILAPGIGAQGGDLAASLQAGLRPDGLGMIIPVSRAVIFAANPKIAAHDLRDQINTVCKDVLSHHKPATSSAHTDLILALHDAECVKFGNFTLASGKQSPIYVDLRRVISYPNLFEQVIAAYAGQVQSLSYDRLAAVPYAALPAAAGLARRLKQPLIYPRKEVKTHGTGQAIEGAFLPGQVALVIEDVVTTGGSILTAIQTLKEAQLVVKDVVVLVDRLQGGRQALAAEGLQLHAVLTIDEIVNTLYADKRISEEMYKTVKVYLEESHASA
ncbi:MAG: orotidine-5'-phosphate decarboxylase [Anaerolineaceae bacterium]|jgi:uridine monophosphate synthetase